MPLSTRRRTLDAIAARPSRLLYDISRYPPMQDPAILREVGMSSRILLLLSFLVFHSSPSHGAEPLVVDWSQQNLGPLDQPGLSSLTLLPSDHHSTVLRCEGGAGPQQMPRCTYTEVGDTLELGGQDVVVGAITRHSEHDGMTSTRQSAVLLLPGERARVLGILDLVALQVVDCATTLKLRRYATADLDGDGGSELCLEDVVERGQGLFHVLGLDDLRLPWFPVGATRVIRAWRRQGESLVALSDPTLIARCPTQPYRFLVPPPALEPATAVRLNMQGERTRFEQCPITASNPCPELEECVGAGTGVAGVGGFAVPPAAPWGPYGQSPNGDLIGLRARVRIASLKGTAQPVLVRDAPLLLWYEVRNFGATPRSLWHAGFWPNHRIWLFDARGKPVPRTQRGLRMDAAFSPAGPRSKNVQFPLSPGGTDDTEGRYDLQALFRIPADGLYLVRVDYKDDLAVSSNTLPFWLVSQETRNLLDQLNGWPKDECDRYERPSSHPGTKASGETNGFIASRKGLLEAAGYQLSWHPVQQRYHIRSKD
jgi:hypothetical protein